MTPTPPAPARRLTLPDSVLRDSALPDSALPDSALRSRDEAGPGRPPTLSVIEPAGPDQTPVPDDAADLAALALQEASATLDRARREGDAEAVALARSARDAALAGFRTERARQRAQAAAAVAVAAKEPPKKRASRSRPKAEAAAPEGSAPSRPRGPVITAPAVPLFRPTVRPSRVQTRHLAVLASLILFVLIPTAMAATYLWTRAADQFASSAAFSVQQEQGGSASTLLSGLSSISGTTSPDTDILYQYLYSQDLVAAIDAKVDLRTIWSRPTRDPVFAYSGPGTIEDLTDYWARMVTVYYNQNARLIEVRVLAFAAADANIIAEAILDQSTVMINRLNEVATTDAVRFAEVELDEQRQALVAARQALTAFRNLNQLVDPTSEAASQSGILAGLEQELVQSYIEFDTLSQNAVVNDPRLAVVERRIQVIEGRIASERQKVGGGTGAATDAGAFVALVADYERLAADVEFAEAAYSAARTALDSARTEARRQSRYLAAHVRPTVAEASRYPERPLLLGVIAVFLFMVWAIAALLFYSLRDRR